MSTIDKAAQVIERNLPAMHDQQSAHLSADIAQALAGAGLLVTPEHDAAVAERAWGEGLRRGFYASEPDVPNPYREKP